MARRDHPRPTEVRASVVDLGWTGPPEADSLPDASDVVPPLQQYGALPQFPMEQSGAKDVAPLPRFPSEAFNSEQSLTVVQPQRRQLEDPAQEHLRELREAIGVSTPGVLPEAHPDAPTAPLFPIPEHIPQFHPSELPRADDSAQLRAMPHSFGAALVQRIRFAGGDVPLWSLVLPLVVLIALAAAFASAEVNGSNESASNPSDSSQHSQSLTSIAHAAKNDSRVEGKNGKLSPLERAAGGEPEAIKLLEAKPAAEVTAAEAFALAEGRSVLEQRAARELREKLERDPGLIKDPTTLTELRKFSENTETARDAIAAIANIPGSISADMLYEVWTSTSKRTSGTELARALLYTKDVRAKASPALSVALDLRAMENCEDVRGLLPKVIDSGDRRSLSMLAKFGRRYGCGANKRQDCYECLRSTKDLEQAQKAVKARREPRPFAGG